MAQPGIQRNQTTPDTGWMLRARGSFMRKFLGTDDLAPSSSAHTEDLRHLRDQRLDSVMQLLDRQPELFSHPAAAKQAYNGLRRQLQSQVTNKKNFRKCEQQLIGFLAEQLIPTPSQCRYLQKKPSLYQGDASSQAGGVRRDDKIMLK